MALPPSIRVAAGMAGVALACGTAVRAATIGLDDLFPHDRNGRVVFAVQAPEDASVSLIGDFNGWDEHATPMRYAGEGFFQVSLPLDPGDHQYKFVVNGRRRLDPSNPEEVDGDDGGVNSRIVVLHDGRVSERSHWQRHAPPHRDGGVAHPFSYNNFDVSGTVSFNRVDGTTLWMKPSFHSRGDFTPEVDASVSYGWASERFSFAGDLAQPILPNRLMLVGVKLQDGTGFDNQAEVGMGENTIAALLFKHDFADYYDVRGVEPYVRLRLPACSAFRVGYATEDYASLTTQTQWSVFKAGRDRFRPNPPLFLLSDPTPGSGAGRLRATSLELVTDSRRARHVGTVGFYGRGQVEIGQGDFDYVRWLADARTYMRLGYPVHLAVRVRAGARVDGDAIPSQKLFYVGGLGTIRGYEFRSRYGDREVLGNIEYTFLFDRLDHGILVFYDAGTAWNSDVTTLRDTPVLQAVGFGFKTSNDDFQVNFAKPVGAVQGGIETTVRLNRTF